MKDIKLTQGMSYFSGVMGEAIGLA